jgi:ABC-type multidrug transport system fused ATPase/permease subunit
MQNIFALIRLIPGYRGRFIRVLLANVLLGLGAVVTPYLFKVIVDSIVRLAAHPLEASGAKSSVIGALIVLALIRIGSIIFGYFQERASDLLFFETMWGLREKLFAHLTQISIDYYEQHRVGEIVQRVTNATQQLRGLLQQWAEGSLLSVLTLGFIIIILLIKLPPVGLLMLLMVPLMLGSAMYRIRQTQPLQRQWMKLAERTVGTITETITLISTIRSFGQEPARVQQFERETAEFAAVRKRHFKIEWRLGVVQGSVIAITSLAALGIVAIGALNGHYTAGDILLVLTYVQMVVSNLQPIVRLIVSTGEVEISAERAVDLLKVQPTVLDALSAKKLGRLESIEFDGVSFSYPGKDRLILERVSFSLLAGQTLALVGPSGVGKTTITKLLLRFYEPTEGSIRINGLDIREYTQSSVRAAMGMVMQEAALFNDTVEANLLFAKPKSTRAEIIAAAEAAHASDFIAKLPDGYKTVVGERGVKLSGGEKQRIAIARAILRTPQLAVLDEATSALDSESERLVQEGLQELLKGRTAIIIAHRLSTVREADQIVVLQHGRVIQEGTHDELTDQTGGLYAYLFKLQTEGVLA